MSAGTGWPGARRRRRGGGSWTPQQLFGPTDVGLWYDYAAITPEMLAWRRNLLLRSEEFNVTASWDVLTVMTVSANTSETLAPDGTQTADKVVETAVTNNHFVRAASSFLYIAGATYTLSFFAKKGTRNWVSISDDQTRRSWFNVDNGTIGTVNAGHTASITNIGNGWYRCAITFAPTGSGTYAFYLNSANGQTSYVGNTNDFGYWWGAQLELSSSVTAYQRITDFTSDFLAAFPTTAIYQDSTGMTPVTALGQPVGLVFDKSRGGAANLGPELVSNGDFSSGTTGWTGINSTLAVVGGALEITATLANQARASQSISTVAGRTYIVEAMLWQGTGAVLVDILVPGIASSASVTTTTPTRRSVVFTATGATTTIRVGSGASSVIGTTYFADNISVREVPGNHAIQSTPTARPVWDARKNLLTRTEEFNDAAWTKASTTISANITLAPNGTTTADALIEDNTLNSHRVQQAVTTVAGATYTLSTYVKKNTRSWVALYASGANVGRFFNVDNGTLGAVLIGAPTSSGIVPVGNQWYLCSITFTATASTTYQIYLASADNTNTYTGDGTSNLYIWGAQLELGSTATSYQRVTTATDYADVGFSRGALFDGSDDFLVTAANLNLSGTDEVTVIVGVDKRINSAEGMVSELSSSYSANNGAFALFAPGGLSVTADAAYVSAVRGTQNSATGPVAASYPAPINNVVTSNLDISSDTNIVRVNGTQVASTTADQGTGNFGSYLLYLGRRGGTTLPLNGRITQLIIIGRLLSAAELAQVERYVANQSGVLIP